MVRLVCRFFLTTTGCGAAETASELSVTAVTSGVVFADVSEIVCCVAVFCVLGARESGFLRRGGEQDASGSDGRARDGGADADVGRVRAQP